MTGPASANVADGRPAAAGLTTMPSSRTMPLSKYEGLGNDFLVLVDLDGSWPINADLARAVCDRHLGFGADGLVRAGPVPDGPVRAGLAPDDGPGPDGRPGPDGPGFAEPADDMTFELRNADGGEAEMSGNGLRCLVHAAIDTGAVRAGPGDSLSVLTPAGRRRVHVRALRGRLDVGQH